MSFGEFSTADCAETYRRVASEVPSGPFDQRTRCSDLGATQRFFQVLTHKVPYGTISAIYSYQEKSL